VLQLTKGSVIVGVIRLNPKLANNATETKIVSSQIHTWILKLIKTERKRMDKSTLGNYCKNLFGTKKY